MARSGNVFCYPLQDSRATSCVLTLVTAYTERDQILQRIVAELAARFYVMDLQISMGATALAPPTVSPEHLLSKCFVFLQAQP